MTKKTYDKKIVGDRLKELRRKKGMEEQRKITQKGVSDETGICVGSIKKYESGSRIPNYGTRKILAEYYGVDEAYILGVSDFKTLFEKLDAEMGADYLKNLRDEIWSNKRLEELLGRINYSIEVNEFKEEEIINYSLISPNGEKITIPSYEFLMEYIEQEVSSSLEKLYV